MVKASAYTSRVRNTISKSDGILHHHTLMDANERALTRELHELDPRLATLLEEGIRLATQADRPGSAFLIAHAGRELSRGVVQTLEPTSEPLAVGDATTVAAQEHNRARIARVLGLPPDDPRVTRWFQLVDIFRSNNKFRPAAADGLAVAAAFREFATILFGRIGPYFEAQAVVDELLERGDPTNDDVTRLRAALGRPALRHYFFDRATAKGWLPLLHAAQLLAPPEPARTDDQGRTSMPPWPEGGYLARVAAENPALVCATFETLAPELDNLSAWRHVAAAAAQLPAPYAGRLATRVALALRRKPFARFFTFAYFPVVEHVARQGDAAAFALTRELLSIQPRKARAGGAQTGEGPMLVHRGDSGPVLELLDPHDVGELLDAAVPALIAADARRSFDLFRERLEYAIRQSEPPPRGSPFFVSKAWCRDLEHPEHDDARERLAAATLVAARTIATAGQADAAWVLDELAASGHEIFDRVALLVLAEWGALTPDRLEVAVCSPTLLDAPWGAREGATLLRRQFAALSTRARRLVAHAIARGPDVGHLRGALAYEGVADPTPEQIAHEVGRWQRARLFWFEGEIPDELKALAETVDAGAAPPTEQDRRLAYDGFYIGGGAWRGERSPLTSEELLAMPANELAAFLAEWRSGDVGLEGPTRRGLLDAVERLASTAPEKTAELASAMAARGITTWGAATALLRGWRVGLTTGTAVPWDAALSLAELACSEIVGSGEGGEPQEAVACAVDLVQAGCTTNRVPAELSPRIGAVLLHLIEADETWVTTADAPASFDGVHMLAFNQLAGRVTATLLDLALWDYRRDVERATSDEGSKAVARAAIGERVAGIAERIMERQGVSGIAAQATLGFYVPQLWLLAPDWFLAARPVLLRGGVANPLQHPLWASYLTRVRYFSALFPVLRPWYVESARALAPDDALTGRSGAVMQHLVGHVLVAVLRGDLALNDPDTVLAQVLDRAPAEQRSRAYWEIYRGWSDADQVPVAEFVERLLAFWRWRLDYLIEHSSVSDRPREAGGLAWLIVTPHLPPGDVLPLARRTLELSLEGEHVPGLWKRLAELAAYDVAASLELLELAVRREARRDYPYLPPDELGPVLTAGLRGEDTGTQERARRMVHWLGEHVSNAYRQLLPDANGSAPDQDHLEPG